jgi:hypothetical protein
MQLETERDTETTVEETDAYRGTQALAWAALLVAVAVFVAGVVFVPRGVVELLGVIRESAATRAQVIEGTVLYQQPTAPTWQQLAPDVKLDEGTRLRTDDRSRVFLTLADGSTAMLYTNTEFGLQRTQLGRFNRAVQDTVLRLFAGRTTLGIARHPLDPDRIVTVLARTSRLDLAEGSFRLELDAEGLVDLSVRTGHAIVFQGDRQVRIGAGQRARLGERIGVQAPLPLERHLIADSLFDRPLGETAWRSFVVTEAGVQGAVAQDGDTLRFVRGDDATPIDRHGESGITQELNRDLRDYVSLQMRADVRSDYQSLSGGGTAGTEYPLMIRLTYLDAQGREQIWARGFYYQNDEGLSVKLGQQVERGAWYAYANPNLLQEIQPAPVYLRRIEVLGSGWAYDAALRRIELTGY